MPVTRSTESTSLDSLAKPGAGTGPSSDGHRGILASLRYALPTGAMMLLALGLAVSSYESGAARPTPDSGPPESTGGAGGSVVDRSRSQWTVRQAEYRGTYAESADFHQLAAELEDALSLELERVGRDFALPSVKDAVVTIEFLDDDVPGVPSGVSTDCDHSGDSCRQVVRASPMKLLRRSGRDLRGVAAHEALHCWMGALHHRGPLRPVRWVEEGIAVLQDGRSKQVLQWFIESKLSGEESLEDILEVENALLRDGTPSHAYSYLAIESARDQCGGESIRRLLLEPDWRLVLRSKSEVELVAFLANVRSHARGVLERLLIGRDSYARGRRAYLAGSNREAIDALAEYVRAHSDGALVPMALVCMGKAAYKLGDWDASGRFLDRASQVGPDSIMQGEILLYTFLGSCKRREVGRARKLGRLVLRDYGDLSEEILARVRRELSRLPE